MENICGVCFTQGELYVLSGFNVPPMCIKCTKSFNAKSALNQYPNRSHPHQSTDIEPHIDPLSVDQPSGHSQSLQHQLQNNHQHSQASLSMPMSSSQVPAVSHSETVVSSRTTDDHKHTRVSNTSDPCDLTDEQIEIVNKIEQSMLQNGDNEVLVGDAAACTLCAKTFTRKSQLLAHMRNHSVDRKFICSFCEKGFTQAANLRNHERIHRNERPFVCSECGKAFTQVTNLNNHRRLHTGERPFVCNEANCGRAFAQVTNLNNHMKTHHKIQQYVCNQCPKKFTQVTTLNQHLLVHSGVRGFACPECPDKSFKQQSHLNQHMKSHGTFSCGQCDQTFGQVSQLTQHMKTHTDLKFKCNICAGAFNQESLLRKHMQRHVDDGFISRLFACAAPKCKQVFADRDQQLAHVQRDHMKPEPTDAAAPYASDKFTCYFDTCKQSFDCTDRLNEHLIMEHKMLYTDVETRSKMNLMFLEQIKHQIAEQYASSMGSNGGGGGVVHNGDMFAASNQFAHNVGMPAHFGQHLGYGSSRRIEDNVALKRHSEASTANDHTTAGGSYCVCSVCFNVYKNIKTLSRHMLRFHGVAMQ